MTLPRPAMALAGAALVLFALRDARAALDDAGRCVLRLAENTAALAAIQAEHNRSCLRDGGPDAQACLATDPSGRLAQATARTAADVIDRCGVFPPFGAPRRLAETATAAARVHQRGLVADLFGADLQGAVDAAGPDKDASRCQATVLRRTERLGRVWIGDYLRCARRALPAASAAADLAACVGGASPGAARAEARLARATAGRCARVGASALFPGRCTGLTRAALATCARARAACRACRLLDSAGALGVDCDALDDGVANASCRMPVSISGHAIPFNGGNTRVAGAEIWILEHPERRMVTSVDGAFQFDDLDEGSEATLVLDHPEYHPIQTGTIRLGPLGAARVTFQAVVHPVYAALAAFLGVAPDPTRCQIVTTVTRVGKSLYDPGAHGEEGATVTLEGGTPGEGPIYFNSSVLPDRGLDETSDDGGVLFVNAPPGAYRWTAVKPGAAFSSLSMKCRPGVLVNASPPWGLQRQ